MCEHGEGILYITWVLGGGVVNGWVGLIESGCIGRLYVWGRGGGLDFYRQGRGAGSRGGGGVLGHRGGGGTLLDIVDCN